MTTNSINNRTSQATSLSSLNAVAGTIQHTVAAKKYDEKYVKESEASFAGVFLFITPIAFTLFCVLNFVQYEGLSNYITIMAVGGVALRLIAARWISSIAREQNRDSAKWMALSLVLPAISLIIIGNTKKLATPMAAKQPGFMYNGQAVFQSIKAKESLQMAS